MMAVLRQPRRIMFLRVHLQVKEVALQMQTDKVDCKMTKEPRACESSASGGATPAGVALA